MKIVIALDSLKGCLTSQEAGQAVAETLRQQYPYADIDVLPIADGGEGTLPVLLAQMQGKTRVIETHNPCMERISTTYGVVPDTQTALIEMAAISGLPLLTEAQRNPMQTSTFGTGELIRDALEQGCQTFIIGLGGSATHDVGIGMLQALGYRFFDRQGKKVGPGGKALKEIVSIDSENRHPLLKNARFIAACDVRNTLYGPSGAAAVFARQKGADEAMIAELEAGTQSFADVIRQTTGKDIRLLPGGGAAGGLGAALAAFLNAELKSGADLLLDSCHFQERIQGADLIITGEGKMDSQSLMGKITGKILERANAAHVPVLAVVGQAENMPLLLQAGFKGVYPITPSGQPLEEAMKPETACRNIRQTILKMIPQHLP